MTGHHSPLLPFLSSSFALSNHSSAVWGGWFCRASLDWGTRIAQMLWIQVCVSLIPCHCNTPALTPSLSSRCQFLLFHRMKPGGNMQPNPFSIILSCSLPTYFLSVGVIRFEFLVAITVALPAGELCSASHHTSPPTVCLRASVLNSQSEWRQQR